MQLLSYFVNDAGFHGIIEKRGYIMNKSNTVKLLKDMRKLCVVNLRISKMLKETKDCKVIKKVLKNLDRDIDLAKNGLLKAESLREHLCTFF